MTLLTELTELTELSGSCCIIACWMLSIECWTLWRCGCGTRLAPMPARVFHWPTKEQPVSLWPILSDYNDHRSLTKTIETRPRLTEMTFKMWRHASSCAKRSTVGAVQTAMLPFSWSGRRRSYSARYCASLNLPAANYNTFRTCFENLLYAGCIH